MNADAESLWKRLVSAYLSGISRPPRKPLAVTGAFKVYMWVVIVAGSLTLVPLVRNLRPEIFADPLFLLLALGTVVSYPLMYLRPPGMFSSLDVADGLIFLLLILFDGEPAVLVMMLLAV